MRSYRLGADEGDPGTIVVRVVASEAGPRAFIRSVRDPSDPAPESVEQSEELPVEEALALAENKRAALPGDARVIIELGPDAAWDPSWGELAER